MGGTSDEVGADNGSSNNGQTQATITSQQVATQMMKLPVPKTPQPMSPLAMLPSPPVFHCGSPNDRSIDDIYNFDEVNEDLENEEAEEDAQGVVNRRSNLPGLTQNQGDSNPLLLNGTVNVVPGSVSDSREGNLDFQNELRATINNFKSEFFDKFV